MIERFLELLIAATEHIPALYFQLPIARRANGPEVKYRERVYCYELYHQLRCVLDGDERFARYALSGEIDKQGHHIIRPCTPDFVFHHLGRMDNLAVIEVKPVNGALAGIRKDLETLAYFVLPPVGYRCGVHLAYGDDEEKFVRFQRGFVRANDSTSTSSGIDTRAGGRCRFTNRPARIIDLTQRRSCASRNGWCRMDSLDKLKSIFPGCALYITEFSRLQKQATSVPLAEFFEPKVPLSLKENAPPDLLMLLAETLTGWASHVSSGARVRMRSLENAFISELLNARLFPAMAMIRAHLETAAFSAYGLEAAGRCAESDQWDAMKRIIPQMLFGTAYKLEKKAPAMQRMLDLSDQEPVRIMRMVEALDCFAEQTEKPEAHWYRLIYAVLCEYTHPTIRSMIPFYTVHKETLAGWDLKYGYQESFNEESVAMAFDMLLRSMQAGYGASLLLASWKFEDAPSGGIVCERTPLDFGQWIWEKILQWPGDLRQTPGFPST